MKKAGSQRSSSHGRELSSFQSWKRARGGKQKENSASLDPFQGYTVLNEITRDVTNDRAVETPYPRAIHLRDNQGGVGGEDVIRKDTTVTVTFETPGTNSVAKGNSHTNTYLQP